MSTQCTGSAGGLEKAEVHTESIQQVQPIDLASRSAGGQVLQLRPVRAFSAAHVQAKSVGGPSPVGLTAVNAPIISVNRPGNLTILPSRGTATQPAQVTQAISTYQIARFGNMRSATLATGQQPASITVTPISASNFSNIRLTGAVNNGSWIQATGSGGQGTFSAPIRAATITVGGRPVRPEAVNKMIIPQQGSVQHVAQLQMVDPKGSILKPSITTAPIVNIRGALQGGSTTGPSVTLPIAPFTIRTANLTNLPTIQQRPQTSNTNAPNQVQKVIAQPPQGAPIQFVNATNKNVIQAITPLPRLNVNAVNAVCLTLSTNATLTPNSSSPVVAVAASKQGATSLIMTPSLATGTGTSGLPLTKVIPIGRDGSTSIVDSLFAQSNSSTSNAVTVSAVSASGTQVSNSGHNMNPTNVVLASPNTSQGISNNSGSNPSQSHHLVHVQGPINVHPANATVGLPPPNLPPGSITSSYFVEKNGNLSLLQPQQRPIALEKRTLDGKSIAAGSMILTTQHPHLPPGSGGQAATVTIPIAAHGAQHVSFAHPISMSHPGGQHGIPGSAQIITSLSAQAHHITSSVLSTMATSSAISVNASSSQTQIGNLPLGAGCGPPPHAIPTHVISQPPISISCSNASSNSANINAVTTSTIACTSVSVTNSSSIVTNSAISVNVSTTSTTSLATTITTTGALSSNSMSSTATAPAQSPNPKSATHSPRPSILRKQRELGDNHISARAQRNLTLQLNFAGNNSNTSCSTNAPTVPVVPPPPPVTVVMSTANKENAGALVEKAPPPTSNSSSSSSSNNSTISNNLPEGLSLLRKEFQPPNEETSWQSCSSHSSGSTTISATSETAEYQIKTDVPNTGMENSSSVMHVKTEIIGNTTSTTFRNTGRGSPISQNGVVRSHGRGIHRHSSSKLQHKDIDRLKRDKEDSVSPRKKPRKQQLTSSDFLEAASPEISFYHARGKKYRRTVDVENNIFDGTNKPSELTSGEQTPAKVVCIIKRPRVSLLSTNGVQVGSKVRLNHFEHYSEVKAKEERRPTISELANQKNIMQKVNGWKIQHMTNQMEQVVDLEVNVVNSFNSLLTRLENKVGPNCPDRDINRIMELLKGNIQRCKVIRDQMSESRSQALRILDHKPRVVDVISKHMTKKPAKKKDRL